MEKDKKMKLVDENVKTIFMTKSEYLELAQQKGWNVKIPQLKNGTYNCDVFGGSGVTIYSAFTISGTLFLKDGAIFNTDISAHEGIILGNHANTYNLTSDNGDIILGNNASTLILTAQNVICGNYLNTDDENIFATNGNVILGHHATTGNISACNDVSIGDDAITDNIFAGNDVSIGNTTIITGSITASNVRIGNDATISVIFANSIISIGDNPNIANVFIRGNGNNSV